VNRIFALLLAGCGTLLYIPGTTVADTPTNRIIIRDVCEKYREAMEERDAARLLSMASPHYYEDSGTPKGEDDYGYEGLKTVIATRMAALRSVRYNIEYKDVTVSGNRAHVDIRYDASFQLATEMGDRWERKQNDKRMELEFDGKRWLFVGGM
jgi:hypothetical protein